MTTATATKVQTETITRLKNEGLVRVKAAISSLPGNKGNKSVHPSTGARWCLRGVKLKTGEVVRLEHFKNGGGQLLTSMAALERFLAATTIGNTTPTAETQVPTPSAKKRAAEQADAKLAEVLG